MKAHTRYFLSFAALLTAPLATSASDGPRLRLAIPEGPWAAPSSYIAAAVMKQHLGFEVEIVEFPSEKAEIDANASTWDVAVAARFPDTHAHLMHDQDLVNFGTNLKDVRFGVVVPEAAPIHNMDDLNEWAAELNFQIHGRLGEIELERRADHAFDFYELDFGMALMSVHEWKENWQGASDIGNHWVAGLAATPGWEWATFEIRFLDDPGQAFGETESLHNIGRADFVSKHEDLSVFLKKFQWTGDEANKVAQKIHTSTDAMEAVKNWVNSNDTIISRWLPDK